MTVEEGVIQPSAHGPSETIGRFIAAAFACLGMTMFVRSDPEAAAEAAGMP